ncbi:MAG: membrane lipoprotein lipid attachment site-containing protein [Bacteroidales bacterium]|nr:membrane lipoprotein lipid attachment site-containing protein [Bacteroidales bacterium]
MKKIIILIGCMLLVLAGCQTSVLDPIEGIFPAPTVVNCTNGTCEASKLDGKRYFDLNLSDGSTTLRALLIGDSYYLTTNAYTEAIEANAKKGNYILGKTSVNGTQVESGTINVTQDGDNYRVKAVLFLTDGKPYRMSWTGKLYFEPDPEPVVLTQVLTAQANANGTVTFKLGTDDMSVDMMGTPVGEGFALTADVYSADGVLHEGVYTAAPNSDNVAPGQYAPGYEYDLSEWGMGIMHWGTCWWTGASVTHISKEPITVEKKGAKFIITWGSEETYPNWATFTGEIEALAPQGPSIDYDYTETVDPIAEGSTVMKHTVVLTDGDVLVAVFELLLEEGNNELAGTYECKEYASEPGLVCNGYNFPDWGISGGSFYMKDGVRVDINAGETLEVKKIAKGAYEFKGSSGYSFSAAGPDYVPGGGDEPVIYPATEAVGPVAEGSTVMKHTITMSDGDAILAVFELLLAEGETNLSGIYECKEYASEPGLVCNGYNFPDWGISGGSFYMKDGVRVDINAGETVTVNKVGDNMYEFVGSTGYTFVCEIS